MLVYHSGESGALRCRWAITEVSENCVTVSSASSGIRKFFCLDLSTLNMKVKCTLVQALRLCTGHTAHRERRGLGLLFLDHGTRRGKGLASRPGRSLPLEKTRYPLHRRLGGPQGRSGQVRKISPPPGFDPRTIQPLASRCTDYATWPTAEDIDNMIF